MRYALNKTKFLTDPEYDSLQTTLERNRDSDARNVTLIWFLLNTGARAQEALSVSRGDLNPASNTVLIRGLKGSNDREIPLPLWLWHRVNRLEAGPDGRLFPISYWRLHQIWGLYRPVHKKLHSTRHTFAMRLYEKTKDLRLVGAALGHRSIANTMVYADYQYTANEMRKLIL